MRLPKPYQDPAELIGSYWTACGGWHGLIRSAYLHASFVFAVLSSSVLADIKWTDTVLQVVPNLIGFSLAGYSVLLGFGNDKFKQVLAITTINDDGHSAYMGFNASFVSFIGFQVIALALAIMARSLPFVSIGKATGFHIGNCVPELLSLFGPVTKVGWFVCWWVFIYALSLALAATLSIFRLARIYDKMLSADQGPPAPPKG